MKEFIFNLQRFATSVGTWTNLLSAISSGDVTLTANINSPSSPAALSITAERNINVSSYTLNTSGTINISGSSATLTVAGTGTLQASTINSSNGKLTSTGAKVIFSDTNSTAYNLTSGNATFEFSSSAVSKISGLNTYSSGSTNSSFTVTKSGGTTVTYTVQPGNILEAKVGDNKAKISSTTVTSNASFEMSAINFDSGTLMTPVCFASNGSLDISSANAYISAMAQNDELTIVDSTDYTKTYGKIKRTSDTGYTLTQGTNTRALSSVTINGMTVSMGSGTFTADTVFNVTSSQSNATFKSATIDSTLNILDNKGQVSVDGSNNLTLTGGNIFTSTAAQTIAAGFYSVSGYGGDNDGITVGLSGSTPIVGGIDNGESLAIAGLSSGALTFYRDGMGLRQQEGDATAPADPVYLNYSVEAGKGYAAQIADLKNVSKFIQPTSGGLLIGGTSHTYSALVLDSTSADSITQYAKLTVTSKDNYKLETIPGNTTAIENFASSIASISLDGGTSLFVDQKLGKDKIIYVKPADGLEASFKVTSATDFTVTPATSSTNTTISGATAITLLSGTITANANQTIKLGENGKTLAITTSTSGMAVTFDSSTSTATINGAANDTFKLDGKVYVIGAQSDGMTFTVDTNGVTLGGLQTSGQDAFTYDNVNYSVMGAGLIKNQTGTYTIWKDNNHSLTGGSVAASALASSENWLNLATVDTETPAVDLSNVKSNAPVTLIGNDFTKTYGNFATMDGGGYSLTKTDGESSVSSVNANGLDTLSMGGGLESVILTTNDVSFLVTGDDQTPGYTVDLSSGASVSGANKASLVSGVFHADSAIAVTANDSAITAQKNTTLDITANGSSVTIGGLTTAESFVIGGTNYTLSKVGLLRSSQGNNQYLLGSKDTTAVTFSEIDSSLWGKLIAAGNFTIDSTTGNALVVDNVSNPQSLYAEYSNGLLTNGGTSFGKNVININDYTVTLSSDFNGASIAGVTSYAKFSVSDAQGTFVVKDSVNGASITGANNITQTDGLIFLSTLQSVTGNNTLISNTAGDGINVNVSGTAATIGLLNEGDSFKVGGNSSYTMYDAGLFDDAGKIWKSGASVTSVALADLNSVANWTDIVSVTADNKLTLPTTTETSGSWVIVNSDKTSVLGSISYADSTYTVTTASALSASINATKSGAIFIPDSTSFTVKDAAAGDNAGATIASATQGKKVDITLTNGKVVLSDPTQTVTVGDNKINFESATDTTNKNISVNVNANGAATIEDITAGDSFKITDSVGTVYEYTLLDDGIFTRNNQIWNQSAVDGSATVEKLLTGSYWSNLITLESPDTLTIDENFVQGLSAGDKTYIVDKTSPHVIYGAITANGTSDSITGYEVSDDGNNTATSGGTKTFFGSVVISEPEKIAAVKLSGAFVGTGTASIPISVGNIAKFNVTTASNGFTINYASGAVDVVSANALTLTSGTLTLKDSNQTITANSTAVANVSGSVTVKYDSSLTVGDIGAGESIKIDDTIYELTSGDGISVNVNGTGTDAVTTIQNLNAGDVFKVGSKEYTMTSIGLVHDNKINLNITTEVTNTQLQSIDTENSEWKSFLSADGGALTLDKDTTDKISTGVIVVDVSDPKNSARYGTLTFTHDTSSQTVTEYELKQNSSSDSALKKITLKGVKAQFPSTCKDADISAKEVVFAITDTTGATFEVDASGTELAITGVTALKLTSGTLAAQTGVPITAGVYKITSTTDSTGDLTVTASGSTVSVGKLDAGDTFTVNGTAYEMTATGLYDAKNKFLVTSGLSDDMKTFTLNDAIIGRVIEINDTTLDLTKETSNALVYNSLSRPTTKYAELTVSGDTLTLKGESNAATKIKTIKIAKDTALNVDFAATVTAPKGTATVNGNTFDGTGTLTINSDGSSSTLFAGTVNLDSSTPSVSATNENSSVDVSNGTITATVAKGKFTKIAALDTGDSFTFNGTTYTQSAVGLVNDGMLCESLKGSSIDVTKLPTANFVNMIASADGKLSLANQSTAVVVDNIDAPTKKFGTLTVSGTSYTIDYATQVETPTGSFTVNGQAYTATTALTLDTTAKTSTLYAGTISLDAGDSATATNDKTALTATGGTITAIAQAGKFTTLNGLDAGESFTFNGKTYTQSALGLTNDGKICADLAGTTLDLSKLDSAKFVGYLAPVNGVINLDDVTASAAVFDKADNPTTQIGNLTKSGSTFTLDFAIKATTSGNVTVNGQAYDAQGDITLDTTATTSTLATGTVELASGKSVNTTSGNSISVSDGDITVAAGNDVTIGALTAGDVFSVDGTEYAITNAALCKGDLIYTDDFSGSITVAQLNSDAWGAVLKISGDTLDINADTAAGIVVSTDINKIYGTLEKTSDGFSLTKGNDDLTAINIDGTKIELAADFASVPLTAGDSTFGNITLNRNQKFTLDDTGTAPTLGNVKSFTLNAGNVTLTENQTVTAGENIIGAVKGSMLVDDGTISALEQDDAFTLNGTNYKLTAGGLLNTDDNSLVTSGLDGSTLTIADMQETQLIAPVNGVIDLDNVTGNARVVDNVSNPTTTLGNVTADGSAYTVDFATKVKASGNVTVNGQSYNAQGDITLDTTATTSTLTSGTVKLEDNSVTTTSGNVIGGNSVTVTAGDEISIGDLTAGDAFTVDGAAYTVNTLAPMNSNGELWTGKDFSSGLTITELADAANWSELFAIADASINITPTTLNDGEDVLLVDDASNPTKIFGTLAKAEDQYTLDTDGESLDAITVAKTVVSVDSALAKVPITTVNADNSESAFTVTPERGAEFFTVDATGNSPTIDGVTEIEVIKGGVVPGEGQTVIPAEDSEEDIKLMFGNGTHTVGDKTFTIDGLKEGNGVSVELNAAGNVKKFSGFDKDSTLTIDGTTYTAPADNATLTYSDADGWYFENYAPESYTVTVDKQGNVSVDVGVKFSDVVSSGKTSSGAITLAADVAETPVTVINQYGELQIGDANGSLVDGLSKTSATIARDNDEIILTLDEGNLTLSAGNYTVNDKKFTAQGAAQVAVADDLTFDLSKSDAITYDAHEFSGTGKLTIGDGLTVEGNVTIAGKTINASEATAITPTADGLTVGETTLTVTGDDTYTINISGGTIIGLEEIGGNVTVGGLSNATVKTNAAGSFTVDKTFTSSSETTYTIADGKLVAAQTELISGDFSNGLTVNETTIHATGGNVSVMSAGIISGADSGVLILAAGGISAEGSFAIGGDVSNFKAGDDTLTLTGNGTATIDIAGGKVNAAHGISGTIAGLDDATVYGATNANVNGKPLDVSGTDCAAVVLDGEAVGLVGVDAGATVASAPTMTVKTIANGTFTFTSDSYNINDTIDGSVDFVTDAQSKVTDIQNFAGELSGAIGDVNLNGKEFSTNDQNVTVTTDGANITAINGLKSGDSIGGDLDNAGFTLPEGSVSVNGTAYTLAGDDEVSVSDGGSVIGGLAKDASLTVSEAGTYKINGRILTAQAGDTFSVNREGVYKTDPTNPPVTEQTPSSEITARGMELVESGSGSVKADDDGVVIRHGSQATVDVSDGGLIVPLSDAVTLENYNDDAKIQTFDYNNVGNAIKTNAIKFGDGEMTLGDAVITFNDNASPNGSTRANLLNASGNALQVGFTHTAGGTLDMSNANGSVLMKGNYAEKSSDTQKSGNSTLIGGDGNDTLLIGGGDVADAGAGTNQIYITDSRLREAGTTIAFTDGRTTVHNFTPGFTDKSDVIRVSDLSAIDFDFNGSTLTMTSGNAQMIFATSAISADLVESADLIAGDDSFKLKVSDGNRTYNTAVAKDGGNITVSDGDAANLFYGDASGINFSEFSGAVEVNLGNASGHVGGSAAKFYGIDKVAAGKGNTTLNGAAGVNNTLIAGIGNTSIWSANGADLMTGNTSANKTGSTTFYYLADDGRDSITGFDFATSATDTGDLILTTPANEITAVSMSGSAVIMQINHSANDYLTLTEAAGKNFRVDKHMAKVDKNVSYDAITTCYVADASNATMTVGENMGDAVVWLCDKNAVLGKYYLGDIKVLDATTANGRNSLVGNDNDNYIYGGTGENSLWGGWNSNDVMQGGSGRNMFFLTLQNGHDTIQNAHDGDVVKLSLYLEHIASADITADGTRIEVTDGTTLEVKSNAAIEYRLADGSTYIADHNSRQWNQK